MPRPREVVQKSHGNPAVEMGLRCPVPTPWPTSQSRTFQAGPPHPPLNPFHPASRKGPSPLPRLPRCHLPLTSPPRKKPPAASQCQTTHRALHTSLAAIQTPWRCSLQHRELRGIPDTRPGAQRHREGSEGLKVTQQTCRATQVHTLPPQHSPRRSTVPGGTAARGSSRGPGARRCSFLPAAAAAIYSPDSGVSFLHDRAQEPARSLGGRPQGGLAGPGQKGGPRRPGLGTC